MLLLMLLLAFATMPVYASLRLMVDAATRCLMTRVCHMPRYAYAFAADIFFFFFRLLLFLLLIFADDAPPHERYAATLFLPCRHS